MIDHLLFSTVVLLVAMAAARFLPLTARTRSALLFCGLAKFVVPTGVLRFVPVDAVPQSLRILGGGSTAMPTQTTTMVPWWTIAWACIATVLFARWLLLRTRTIAAAMRSPAPPSQREIDAVRDARGTMHIRAAIDVVRSPICEAPAVLRVVRPVIVLPLRGTDDLDREELRSLVLHECAHVARRDNLATFFQAAATSLLWFHPLVWLASQALTTAREEACDEAVADAMQQTDSYVAALLKICHAIVAPRAAGASCMASAKIKERMEHLMNYETIKKRAWSHRAIVAASAIFIALSTLAASLPAVANDPYTFTAEVDRSKPDTIAFHVTVRDRVTGKLLADRIVTSAVDQRASIRFGSASAAKSIEFFVDAKGNHETAEVFIAVTQDGRMVQRRLVTYDFTNPPKAAPAGSGGGGGGGKYDGEPVSIDLKNAKLRDVMNTFGQLSGWTFDVAPDADALITISVKDMPWDQALDMILTNSGLVAEIDGKTIRVSKKK
jgi:beta-lactamase regulating signal transducer with metallopeptidase domain